MRILLILLLIYFLFRIVFRLVLPLIGRYMFNKAVQSMQGQQSPNYRQAPPRREGEVRIENQEGTARQGDDGEFVDYVEIK